MASNKNRTSNQRAPGANIRKTPELQDLPVTSEGLTDAEAEEIIGGTKFRPEVQALEERALMSASPLVWNAPAGSHHIYLETTDGQIEVFDSFKEVASGNVGSVSAIEINVGGRANLVNILSTPAGVPTTINLQAAGDAVFVGFTGFDPGKPLSLTSAPHASNGAANVQAIAGAVTINGARSDSVTVDDSLDTGIRQVVISRSSIAGLAPATIGYAGIGLLSVNSNTGHSVIGSNPARSLYSVTGTPGNTTLTLEGTDELAGVTSTAGSVTIVGKGLFDSAGLVGPKSGTNILTAGPGGATLRGTNYLNAVRGFDDITIESKSASDIANLSSSRDGNNTLTVDPTSVQLTQGIEHLDADGFATVHVYGSGQSGDTATVTGPATGTNTLVAFPGSISLSATGYFVSVSNFRNTATYSESPNDLAFLSDAKSDPYSVTVNSTQATQTNAAYSNRAFNFPSVTAFGGNPGDTAYLAGASSGTNKVVATPTSTSISGAGFSATVKNFPTVYAYSTSAGDAAFLSGTGSFLWAVPTSTQVSGPGYFIQTSNFPNTYENLTQQTFDLTSTGALLQARGTANNLPAMIRAAVPAPPSTTNWTTVDSAFLAVGVGPLVSANDVWDLSNMDGIASGVHVFGAPSAAALNMASALSALPDTSILPGLLQDMVRDGEASYAAMLDTFSLVEALAPLSAGMYSDLQRLVSSAPELNMPGYVADLANDVINGQQANGTFQSLDANGNVVSSPMGNLHVGSSGAQLTELVDTWFRGEDEPGSLVSYEPVTGNLYNRGGPVFTDVVHDDVDVSQDAPGNDLWLAASIAEVAARNPSLITSMFTNDGTNTVNGAAVGVYTVRFFSQGMAHYVTVDTELPSFSAFEHSNGALWAALLEKAYAEANSAGWVQSGHNNANSYDALHDGDPSYALPALTGQSAAAKGGDISAAVKAFQAGQFVCLQSSSNPSSLDIVPNSSYALISFNPSSNTPFQLYNPWAVGLTLVNATWAFVDANFSGQSITAAAGSAGGGTPAVALVDLLAQARVSNTAKGTSSD